MELEEEVVGHMVAKIDNSHSDKFTLSLNQLFGNLIPDFWKWRVNFGQPFDWNSRSEGISDYFRRWISWSRLKNIYSPTNSESIITSENENEETNGFSVNQNGADVAHLSSGDEEVRVGSNGTTFSTCPDTAVGLRYVESLLGESSSSANGKLADITTAEAAAEYDVEGVYCPYCKSLITTKSKRVILRTRKRKRKIQEISTGEEIISSGAGQIPEPVETSQQDALTCFSCLKIFIPTGKGFLCWKFGIEPDTDLQPESPQDIPYQAEPSLATEAEAPAGNTITNASIDEDTGKLFPMSILTCCQPYRDERKTEQQVKSDDVPDIRVQLLVSPGQRPAHKLTVIPPDDPPPTTHLVENLEGQLPRDLPNRGVSGLDVIRAIVYGGLLETIASLSIIASAAGGDATTLNIVALGLANVFGGLIVLFHNLRELKNDPIPEHYEEQLGRQGHFLLHATIAFISYLVFGLMAPVIYGFSFRKSDDKNLKLITLAAASLVCITILSIAKAYVQRPPKNYFKTIFYYATIGVMVSGLGYVSGGLINDALKKLGVFDSRAPVNMSVLEIGAVKAASSSY